MAWEKIKKLRPGSTNAPDGWYKYPCLKLNKTGISFNDHFMTAYGLEVGDFVLSFIDLEGSKIGFKKAGPQDDRADGYKLSGKGCATGAHMANKLITETFSDRLGMVFRAMLNNGERIIEVDMDRPL